MSTSSILGITLIEQNQQGKYLTANAAIEALAVATNAFLLSDYTAGNVTLTDEQFTRNILFRSDNLTTPRLLTVPASKRMFAVDNTDGTDPLTVTRGSGTVVVPSGETRTIYTDGTTDGIVAVGGGGGTFDGTFLGLSDSPSSYSGEAGKVVQVNGTEDGLEFGGVPGQVGAMGPWELLESHTFANEANWEATSLGGADIVALMIVFTNVAPATDDTEFYLQYRIGGSLRTANYTTVNSGREQAGGANVGASTNFAAILIGGTPTTNWGIGNGTDESVSGHFLIFDPHGSSLKRGYGTHQNQAANGNNERGDSYGLYTGTGSTGDITGLNFLMLAGNILTGSVYIYGLRSTNPLMPVDVASFTPDTPSSSQIVMRHVFTRDVDFPDDFAGSLADAEVAATASTDFDILLNGGSIGTLNFAISADTGTFVTAGGAVAVTVGDVLMVVAPASPDATLADVSITLAGTADFA